MISRFSPLVARLGFVAVAGLLAAMITGRPELVAFALPALAVAAVALSRAEPGELSVRGRLETERCFEGNEVKVSLEIESPDEEAGQIDVELRLPIGLELVSDPAHRVVHSARRLHAEWTVRPIRWGRWSVGPATVRVRSPGLARTTTRQVVLGSLTVFPPAPQARDVAVPPVLMARIGSHVSRRRGTGVEFAEVRAYAPGDSTRSINWSVSTRTGDLHVNARLAERAADLVLLVDMTVDVGPWGRSSLDVAVRGAAAVARAYLGYADRVGLVALGGVVRWLTPDLGDRQYYRIVEMLLAARRDESFVDPELDRLPPQALPPRALALVFSPLIDPRAIEAVRDLRERGRSVAVVDVLGTTPEPAPGESGALAARIWRLDRDVLVHGLREMGVPVVPWDPARGAVVPFGGAP